MTCEKALELYKQQKDSATSLRSVSKVEGCPSKWFTERNGMLSSPFGYKSIEMHNLPRQNFPQWYLPNGYIDIVKPEVFMTNGSFHGERVLMYETNQVPDIDTIKDLLAVDLEDNLLVLNNLLESSGISKDGV